MENDKEYGLGKREHDYPHEDFMDEKDIQYEDLIPSIQREIETFNKLYYDSWIDGVITPEEEKKMLKHSENIARTLEAEYKKQSNDGGMILGIFGSIILGVGAYFGIKTIAKL